MKKLNDTELYFNSNNELVINSKETIKEIKLLSNKKVIYENTINSTSSIIKVGTINLKNKYEFEITFSNDQKVLQDIVYNSHYDSKDFIDEFTSNLALGAIYSKDKTIIRLWAPISTNVELNLYNQGHPNYDINGKLNDELKPFEVITMNLIDNGVWEIEILKDLSSIYYTFNVTNHGITNEVTDPYSYSSGANSLRSMIVDFSKTNPVGSLLNRPQTINKLTDYIPYELHIRDLTIHDSWNGNISNRGKYLGFTEDNTFYEKNGVKVTTGLAHIKELGINAVQLLPIFDSNYIDEVENHINPNYDKPFNWGYMGELFNTLEGSYSSNPFDGLVRIKEFKELVNSLHKNDIRIIMDVVYNHTAQNENSNFHKIVPGYYHRMNNDGSFSNGSACGNETASERPMMQKFIIDSLVFFTNEYNLSGYRFDLMALHDKDTMLLIEKTLHEIDPTIVIYGEPWDAGGAKIKEENAAGKFNIKNMNTIGAFNDISRDAIRGSVFIQSEGAWVQGQNPKKHLEAIKYGIAGGSKHRDVNIDNGWHQSPIRTINYVTAHDNNTLHDKLMLSGATTENIESLVIQSNAIVLTSLGIPFLHAGVEFMRSKPSLDGGYDDNSYQSPDSVNQLRWDLKVDSINVFNYYKELINIRKNYPQLKIDDSKNVDKYLTFIETNSDNIIGYSINIPGEKELLVYNVGILTELDPKTFKLNKEYSLLSKNNIINSNGIENTNLLELTSSTSFILVE